MWIRTTGMSWGHTTEPSLGALFEICLRRCRDVLMRRRCYVLLWHRQEVPIWHRGDIPLRLPGNVPARHRWMLIWDVPSTSLGRTQRRHYDVATMSCCWVGQESSIALKWFQDKYMKINSGKCHPFVSYNKYEQMRENKGDDKI